MINTTSKPPTSAQIWDQPKIVNDTMLLLFSTPRSKLPMRLYFGAMERTVINIQGQINRSIIIMGDGPTWV